MKFLGEKLKFGERASMKNVPVGTPEESIWDEKLFFNIESETIKKYIQQQVQDAVASNPEVNKENLWKKLEDEIRENYIISPDTELIERVKNKEFAKIIPSKKQILMWWILFVVSVLIETSILAIQTLFSGSFNPVILIYGFLLGLGGFFLGEALGDILFYNEFAKLGEIRREHRLNVAKLTIFAVVGILLIAFVAIVRSFGAYGIREKFVVIAITVLLGLSVAVIDGYRKKLSELRKYLLIEQERGLRHVASALHAEAIKHTYKNFFDQAWNTVKKEG